MDELPARRGPEGCVVTSKTETGWRASVEMGFERWGAFIVRHRYVTALLALLVTLFFGSFVPQIRIDNTTEAFLLDDDPAVITYNAFRDEFSRDDKIIIALQAEDVLAPAVLERVRELHRAIEDEVPYVDEVDSLLNARVMSGGGGELRGEELLEEWPAT